MRIKDKLEDIKRDAEIGRDTLREARQKVKDAIKQIQEGTNEEVE